MTTGSLCVPNTSTLRQSITQNGDATGWQANFTDGGWPTGLALSRASSGSVWQPGGVLGSRGTDAPRLDTHPITGAPRGLLLEGARTNVA
jgi:hypothetical protein